MSRGFDSLIADLMKDSMKLIELIDAMSRAGDGPVHIYLPDSSFVPVHYHLTEVGLVTKKFVDCGGNPREQSYCSLQIWVADDVDHRLTSNKFLGILRHGAKFIPVDAEVILEVQKDTISLYPVQGAKQIPERNGLTLTAGFAYTTCLAPDKCGVKGCC
jgi:hypothetical protein